MNIEQVCTTIKNRTTVEKMMGGTESFWYLATPYSKYAEGHEQAFRDASLIAAELMRRGIPVFCPIAHSHPISVHGGIDEVDHDVWLWIDEKLMRAAAGLIVAMLPGWETSFGVTFEQQTFAGTSKPIFYLDTETLTGALAAGVEIRRGPDANCERGHTGAGEYLDFNGHAPDDSAERKARPVTEGVIDYFPDALLAVARVSKMGNEKHNPGEPLHWARGKSTDHADCIARHLIDRDHIDAEDDTPHVHKLAWRALALCQEFEERLRVEAGYHAEDVLPRGAK